MLLIVFLIVPFISTPLALRILSRNKQSDSVSTQQIPASYTTQGFWDYMNNSPIIYNKCYCDGPNLDLKLRKKYTAAASKHHITLVTTSIGESDKLEQSLKCNKAFVNKIIVITAPSDEKTQRICDTFGVRCHLTDAFHQHGDAFNKGRALQEVQLELHREATNNSVVMLIDSDICLPSNFLKSLPSTIPPNVLFSGIERCMFANSKDYSRGWPAVQGKWVFKTMGFLQIYLAHSTAPTYFTNYPTAAESDLVFGNEFQKQEVLPIMPMQMGISPSYGHWQGIRTVDSDADTWASAALPPEGACPCCINLNVKTACTAQECKEI